MGNQIDLIGETDENGMVVFANLLAGEYTVTEIETDIRYVVPDEQEVNLTWGEDESISFHNELKRMTITVSKTAEDSEQVGLAAFKFRLTGIDYMGNQIDLIGETDENGVVIFENLLAGEYAVIEIETDIRYIVPDEQEVNLTWGVDESISFQNTLKRMIVTVNKTAEDSKLVGLAGFKFRLTGIDYMGNTIDIIGATDETGVVVFEDLLAGEYTVTEVETDIRYVVPDEQIVNLTWGVDETISVQNTLKRMTITVNKTTEDGELVGLSGFKFRLTSADYLGNKIDIIGTTDENGVIVFNNLLAGEYTVTEIETDIRYVVPDEQIVDLTWGVDESIDFHNELKRMTITVNKTAEDGVLDGHSFRLTGIDYLGNKIDLIGTTDENGVIVFDNLLAGEYTVTEIETDIRYVVPDEQIVNLTWGVDEAISFHNTLKRMTVTVGKTAEDSELVGLAGYKFRLTGVDYLGNNIDIIGTTDKTGIVSFGNLLAGTYTVTEIETDIRYIVPDEQTVNLTWGVDETISVHNELKRMTVTVNKTAEDGVLDGHKFRLSGTDYLGNNIDIIGTTNENGVVVFEDLLAGEYTVTEIETDIRYVVPADEDVTLTWGVDESVEIYNELKRMTITVNKTAEDGVLDGHKFRLSGTDYLGNTIVIIGTTDENGVVVFENLLAGEYTVIEIETNIRYVVPDAQEVNLTWGVDEAISVHNELKRMTITVNKTAEDGVLEGHKFRLTGIDYLGNKIDLIGTTDENGMVVFENLLAGEYTVTEIETDVRYVVPDDQIVDLTWGVNEAIGFENTLKRMTITVNKTAEDDVLDGHTFRLTGIDYLGNTIDITGITDENGVIVFDNLLAGTYTVTEIETDIRYVVPDNQIVDLTWGNDESMSFHNALKKTNVTANKVWFDCDDQDGLRADVQLTLTGSDGSVYTGIIPLGETSFTWTNLPMYDGDELIVYTLTEAEIEGYESEIAKSEDGYSFTATNTHTPPPPQTGDNGLLLGGLALLSLIGSALMIGKRKRRGYEV